MTAPDDVDPPRGPEGRLLERAALGALLLGMLASLPWFVHGWYDPTNDGAMYVLTARSLLAGEGYSMLGIPFQIRPPGFAVLLAPLLALRGLDLQAIHLFVSLWGIAGCFFLYRFARARLAWPVAWLLAAALWLNPGYQLLCNQVMSDVPGTTLLLAAFSLERWVARRPSARRDLVLGLFLGASAYVRSIDVLLAPAIVAARLLRRFLPVAADRDRVPEPWRPWLLRGAVLLLSAVLVQVPWSLRNSAAKVPPPADQTLLYDYSTAFWHEDMGDPNSRRLSFGEVLARIPVGGGKAIGVLGSRMTDELGGQRGDAPWAWALLAAIAIVLAKRRESPEIFALGSMLLIAVYFGFAPRLLLPILVVALPAAAEVLQDLGARTLGVLAPTRRRTIGSACAAAGVAALLLVDLEPRKDWDKIAEGDARLRQISAGFERQLAPDAVLASYRAWHYAVLMERPIYALEFVFRRSLDEATNTVDIGAIEGLIDKYGINTVVLSPGRVQDRQAIPYFESRYDGGTDPISRVYRVRE